MPTDLQTLTDELTALRTRRLELADELETINRSSAGALSAGHQTRWDDTERAIEKLDARMLELANARDNLLARSARVQEMQRSAVGVTGDGAQAAGEARASFSVGRSVDVSDSLRSALAAGGTETVEGGRLYLEAAKRSIEGWESLRSDIDPVWQEQAERLCRPSGFDAPYSRGVAKHIATFSDPEYVAAFDQFLRGGRQNLTAQELRIMVAAERSTFERTALNEGSVATGQAIVPPFLDPAIILTNTGIVNPFRQLCTTKTITTQTWKGVTSAGVSAEWTAEAAEMTDASPTFVQPTITPVRADAYIQASFEVLEDTSIASDLAGLIADAKDRLEGTAFAVGTGSTQPFGIVTELQLTTASRTAANTNGSIGLVDLYNLDTNLPPRYRPNASFVMNKGIVNIVRQAAIPSLTNFSPWVDFGGATPSKAIGYPVYEASGMQGTLSTATASNDDVIVLGDFRQGMFIVDRLGLTIGQVPFVMGANRRPTGEIGWGCWWRVGAGVVSPSAFQLLRV